ncbi:MULTISPECIES: PGRP and LysM peptidoglycan-binding domain-containing protein [unclassified Pseudoalteromonas]|uniref:PGRP and LysM peptidoglycan-binding domain-containing protein n=1 Tax=unclassified Pseudoalteromonas TaxID=194690 RepID=UPI0016001144|nr:MULTISPECIES: peptidoglycan-binding protein [unclassified Pseudoalteromonas]MBB1335683.1 peptidoglycan-binding protein [Pseudoalteromonas sp. SR41-6]MBB1461233.1 peptidoglycan-binding protein [Pseudoalteromonas sp. SG41-8]MBB1471343.1 peptidoglycan-binding protein [Pseudoalteromonas sp. SG41-5]
MIQQHTVAQGETLLRIARQYGYKTSTALYNHPSNAEFKALRPDPNLIFPGDIINIPPKKEKFMPLRANSLNTFVVKNEKEYFRLQIIHEDGDDITGKRIVLNIGSQTIDTVLQSNRLIEIELNNNDALTGSVDLYLNEGETTPTKSFNVQIGNLDPIDTLSGVQGRCNMLGFNCGKVDGVNGTKTKAGVKEFQQAQQLQVDGIAGPVTKSRLVYVYGA